MRTAIDFFAGLLLFLLALCGLEALIEHDPNAESVGADSEENQ